MFYSWSWILGPKHYDLFSKKRLLAKVYRIVLILLFKRVQNLAYFSKTGSTNRIRKMWFKNHAIISIEFAQIFTLLFKQYSSFTFTWTVSCFLLHCVNSIAIVRSCYWVNALANVAPIIVSLTQRERKLVQFYASFSIVFVQSFSNVWLFLLFYSRTVCRCLLKC